MGAKNAPNEQNAKLQYIQKMRRMQKCKQRRKGEE